VERLTMAAKTTTDIQPQAAEPVAELLPQAGGSYIRLPDGGLQPAGASEDGKAIETTPQE